ncbi:hypothetical protein A6F55_24090 [Prescottella equi]|nr:hypothetical protein A6F55_24090 [Prescottella equi]
MSVRSDFCFSAAAVSGSSGSACPLAQPQRRHQVGLLVDDRRLVENVLHRSRRTDSAVAAQRAGRHRGDLERHVRAHLARLDRTARRVPVRREHRVAVVGPVARAVERPAVGDERVQHRVASRAPSRVG